MQCDVNGNSDDPTGQIPYLLDVQADLLSDLTTRVVVPLVRAAAFMQPAARLHPMFAVAGQDLVMATHLVTVVRQESLGACVASLGDQREAIVAAMEFLRTGA